MRVDISWRDPKAKYRWNSKEVDLPVIPRKGEEVQMTTFFAATVTEVLWRLDGEIPRVEVTLGEDPYA